MWLPISAVITVVGSVIVAAFLAVSFGVETRNRPFEEVSP